MALGIIFGVAAGALWGFSFIIPFVLPNASSELISAGRFGVYALVSAFLLLPQLKSVLKLLNGSRILWLLLLSVTGNSLYYILMVDAVRLTGVAITSIIVGALPVTIAIFGARSSAELKKFSGPLLLIVFGITVVQWPMLYDFFTGHAEVSFKGTLLAFAAHVSWLIFALMNARFLKLNTDISPKIWSELLGVGSFGTLAFYIVYRIWTGHLEVYTTGITMQFIALSFVLGCFGSVLGNWFWNEASKRLSTAFVGQLIVSETIFAIIYECIYLQKTPQIFEMLSLVLLALGVIWASKQARQRKLLN
ncbi:MAG: DMT family transporter [Bdellovibrionaceae bacterium]|nr:DMT family transporter [Pseudobdellovibrionaceae bacterium]